jgi:hypothetical protein
MSLALITIELRTRNEEEEKRSKRKISKEHDKTPSSSHYCFEWNWDLERFWFTLLCLILNALALVLNVLAENLDPLKCWWLGVFIAPTIKVAVGEGCCRMAYRTVRCTTGHCPARQPRHPTVRVRPLELWHMGLPDTHCTLSGAPSAPALTSARAVRAL